jgi:hypothetical protein
VGGEFPIEILRERATWNREYSCPGRRSFRDPDFDDRRPVGVRGHLREEHVLITVKRHGLTAIRCERHFEAEGGGHFRRGCRRFFRTGFFGHESLLPEYATAPNIISSVLLWTEDAIAEVRFYGDLSSGPPLRMPDCRRG